jgi:Flp pilus assembly protein TadD
MALLGASCAAGAAPAPARGRGGVRLAAAAALIVVAVLQLPLFLSERYLRDGVDAGTGDLAAAYSDLDRAADLNPWSPAPLLAEGEIAADAGDLERALAALREAEDRKPIDWTPHYIAAIALAPSDPAAARRELQEARRRNPLGEDILAAEAALDRTSKP